jgi:hypothetical protein
VRQGHEPIPKLPHEDERILHAGPFGAAISAARLPGSGQLGPNTRSIQIIPRRQDGVAPALVALRRMAAQSRRSLLGGPSAPVDQ